MTVPGSQLSGLAAATDTEDEDLLYRVRPSEGAVGSKKLPLPVLDARYDAAGDAAAAQAAAIAAAAADATTKANAAQSNAEAYAQPVAGPPNLNWMGVDGDVSDDIEFSEPPPYHNILILTGTRASQIFGLPSSPPDNFEFHFYNVGGEITSFTVQLQAADITAGVQLSGAITAALLPSDSHVAWRYSATAGGNLPDGLWYRIL